MFNRRGTRSQRIHATTSFTYAWGPNGHPVIFGEDTSPALTLHWDGDTPLFVTQPPTSQNPTGLVEIKVEGLGYYVPGSPFKFVDRNQSGFAVAAHWAGGTAPWNPADAYHQTCSGIDYSGAVLFEPGPDGISDGVNVFQGVRSYDPALGAWTTPDAYAGDAGDPMSRKSFMWNRNNSLGYMDPSGYDATPGGPDTGELAVIDRAAIAASRDYYDITQSSHKEYGGAIICTAGDTSCSYTVSTDSGKSAHQVHSDWGNRVPAGDHVAAYWHTHAYARGYDN